MSSAVSSTTTIWSLPAPPRIEAAGPLRTSLPLPPSSVSACVPPLMLSSPSSP
jgi:hypothetical protein